MQIFLENFIDFNGVNVHILPFQWAVLWVCTVCDPLLAPRQALHVLEGIGGVSMLLPLLPCRRFLQLVTPCCQHIPIKYCFMLKCCYKSGCPHLCALVALCVALS